jgi:hypothetical protein
MGGGLMQLVAYGAQDIYLTGNPQITFFKVVYRRHTNFSMEEIKQTASGTEAIGSEATYTISRNGDLVHKMYVQYKLPAMSSTNSVGNLGHALLKEIECEIGGQKIDKHYGHWLSTWSELTTENTLGTVSDPDSTTSLVTVLETATKYAATRYQKMAGIGMINTSKMLDSDEYYFVPLQFWFNRNPGLALPLIALQYHEVKIKITFETATNLYGSGDTGAVSPELFTQYIYLDTDERRRFAQVSHEYLIEQLQFQSESAAKQTFTLNFNHPVKELIWTGVPATDVGASDFAAPSMDIATMDPAADVTWQIKLNGHDRTAARDSTYYTRQQVYDYHSGYGGTFSSDSIAVYSFALKPEEHQPSGTCNFSRIDTAQLNASTNTTAGINIYAVNYNVLRIMSGMGGLAYSN